MPKLTVAEIEKRIDEAVGADVDAVVKEKLVRIAARAWIAGYAAGRETRVLRQEAAKLQMG